jgi:hypothetical protein
MVRIDEIHILHIMNPSAPKVVFFCYVVLIIQTTLRCI